MDRRIKSSERGTASPDENTELAPRLEGTWLTPEFDNIFNQFQRSFELLMPPMLSFPQFFQHSFDAALVREPAFDLEDYGDQYKAVVELPGLSKDQVEVKVDKNSLEIRAEKKNQSEQKDKNSIHREQSYSAFQPVVDFRDEILPEKVESRMKNGILEITLPKKEPTTKKQLRKVPVEG